ncbi:MAG TPA: Hsp20/alpha crystallin family protein [Saprospiraceae bacterium]|nr:Hsp20/alpha crystallin family protein [Saprospiraceae bacterium]
MIKNSLMTDFPISKMMDDFLNTSLGEVLDHVPVARPKINSIEHEDAYLLEVTVPGMNKENIHMEIVDETLTIQGKTEEREEEEEEKFFRREFQLGAFKRSFKLPKAINADNIEANCKDGILYIRLPKMEKVASRKTIEIA